MWINEQTLEVYRSHAEIRLAFPNTSFPPSITDEDIADFGVVPVQLVERPGVDHTKNVAEGDPALAGGVWTQTWIVTDASAEEVTERTEAQWASIRTERNQLLSVSDWTQLPDAPVDAAAWAAYRQELRDITNQPDPFNITWPTEPGA